MPPARKTPARSTRPDDKPFDFNLDAVKAEVDTRPWVCNWAGRSWTFLHFQELDIWDQLGAAAVGDREAIAKVFEFALGEEQWAEFRQIRLPLYKTTALFDAYADYCGIDKPGESQDSEPS